MFNRPKSNPADTASSSASTSSESVTDRVRQSRSSGSITSTLESAHKPAIISEEFTIRGDIESDGTLHVEGKVIGTVKAAAVNVSKTGSIEGDVNCQHLTVKGRIEGNIVCEELSLSATADIRGTSVYRFINVDRGARIACEMKLTG